MKTKKFRCVNFEDVEQMLDKICKKGDCSIFSTVVPSNKEEFGKTFVLKIFVLDKIIFRKFYFWYYWENECMLPKEAI